MNLSHDVQDILNTMRVIKENLQPSSNKSPRLPLDRTVAAELIDIDNINFEDDETWLYESSSQNSNVKDLKAWLYPDTLHLKDYKFHSNHLILTRELAEIDTKKMIDSRTFTRPKKRLVRPSIERYNDGYFGMSKFESDSLLDENESNITLKVNDNLDVTYCAENVSQQPPLKFDLSEPINTTIFEKIMTQSDVDSFQNMSPPSLINSMCSSTFTNLMENSMIKNDPLLREISVTDYTEAMLQDYDPPLFRSITDSCSSINLDNPESFIKQNSEGLLNGIYKKSVMSNKEVSLNETYVAGENSNNSTLGDTYVKDSSSDISSTDVCNDASVIINSSNDTHAKSVSNISSNLNGTYRKSLQSKLNETFEKSSLIHSNDNLNSTITYMNDSNRFTSPRRRSYIVDKHHDNTLTHPLETKRNSVGHSVGSSDSLDYLSSLSSGSRDSNKMLNMAEVDAIVLQQEQSLHAMSTPKPTSKIISKLWEHSTISPVSAPPETSDSDPSSNDEYKTGRSTISLSDSISSGKSNKSVENVEPSKISPKSLNGVKSALNNKGSYSNLRTVGTTLKGSYGNLNPLGANIKGASYASNKGSTTNLKTMSTNLKGSYTQLKPVLSNLPFTNPNVKSYNSDLKIMKRPNVTNYTDANIKTVEVAPTLRDLPLKDQVKSAPFSNSYAKPQSKASGLPRPISSIPRPSVSKIPGPKSRPLTSRPLSRPISKNNIDYDF